MTKHEKWTEWPTQAYAAAYESLAAALDGFQNKFEVPETAREFVKRSAATAKDRSSDLYTGANKVTDAVEKALVSAVNGIADVNRKTVEAMYQDAQSVFAAIDKLADAQSFAQAYKVYARLPAPADQSQCRSRRGDSKLCEHQGFRGFSRLAGRCRESSTGAVAGRLMRRHSKRLLGGRASWPPFLPNQTPGNRRHQCAPGSTELGHRREIRRARVQGLCLRSERNLPQH